ncbi:MAG: hypothetical protein ACKVP3_23490 [Hyphomicrobiaceae bacterium]
MTPWQARLFLLGFLLVGSAIAANLLVMQDAKVATSALKQKSTPAARAEALPRRPAAPERRDAKSVAETKPARPETAPKPKPSPSKASVVPARGEKSARPPQTTASTR